MASTPARVTLVLLVDKENNRVVFAESSKDFVDVLFSFLTLPLGTIVRLLGKKSSLGSMDRLYESVEKIESQYLQGEGCRAMLLHPRNAAWARCKKLALDYDDSDPVVFYKCRKWGRNCCVSPYPGGVCVCGQELDSPFNVSPKGDEEDGVFLKGSATSFMVSDDLHVMPVSMGASLALLNKLGIRDSSVLEKRTVCLGTEEILRLLKRSLVSETPLTDVFLQEPDIIVDAEKSIAKDIIQARIKNQKATIDSKKINLKLFLIKESNNVVYAEAGEDFVDFLFSFLTFPLGSILKLLEKHSCSRSIDNLYKSAEILSSSSDCMKSEECKDMLLSPKLAPYFGCSNQLLEIDEMSPKKYRAYYNSAILEVPEQNPRFRESGSKNERGFVKGLAMFMVTDDMAVTPLSPICGVHIINKLMVPINDLEEVQASLGEVEAMNMLRACLISRTALSDVFSPMLLTLLEDKWCGPFYRKSDLQ